MMFDPYDASLSEATKAGQDTRKDERAYALDRELDQRTVRQLFRNETNARRV